jgi:hypothetical protein
MFNGMTSLWIGHFRSICTATTLLALASVLSQVRIAALHAIRLFIVVDTDGAEFAVKFYRMTVVSLLAKLKTWKRSWR